MRSKPKTSEQAQSQGRLATYLDPCVGAGTNLATALARDGILPYRAKYASGFAEGATKVVPQSFKACDPGGSRIYEETGAQHRSWGELESQLAIVSRAEGAVTYFGRITARREKVKQAIRRKLQEEACSASSRSQFMIYPRSWSCPLGWTRRGRGEGFTDTTSTTSTCASNPKEVM